MLRLLRCAAVSQVLKALLDRLRNEITRLTAVKAFATIASSPLNIDLSAGGPAVHLWVMMGVCVAVGSWLWVAGRALWGWAGCVGLG